MAEMDLPDLGRRNSTCSTSTQRTYKSAGLGAFAKVVTEDEDHVKTEEKRSDCYNSDHCYNSDYSN